MSSRGPIRRVGCSIASAALLVSAEACAAMGQAQSQPQPPHRMEALGVANMQPAPATLPNTPTAAYISISEDILRACDLPDADAFFEFDAAQLTKFDRAPLDTLAVCFKKGALSERRMALIGHSDRRAAPDYDVMLGQSRADAVAAYLTDAGLDAARMETSSRGARDATGREALGWANDRRVEIRVASPRASSLPEHRPAP